MLICGVPNNVGNADCMWPRKNVTVSGVGSVNGIPLVYALEIACKRWNAVCGINLTMGVNHKTADIQATVRGIDGVGRTLAQCELPCGYTPNFSPPLNMLVDGTDAFVLSDNPPNGKIDLARTITHELGHGIGIGHIADGNLMAPMYSNSIYVPQNGDIVEARSRYGQVSNTSPTTPTINPTPTNTPSLQFVDPTGVVWVANILWTKK